MPEEFIRWNKRIPKAKSPEQKAAEAKFRKDGMKVLSNPATGVSKVMKKAVKGKAKKGKTGASGPKKELDPRKILGQRVSQSSRSRSTD